MGPTLACCRAQLHHLCPHLLAAEKGPRMGRSWTVTGLSTFLHASVCVWVCVCALRNVTALTQTI